MVNWKSICLWNTY